MIALWLHSIRVKKLFKIFEREEREKRKDQVSKGCIRSISDDEEIEVSDEEETETEANLPFPVTFYHVKNMFAV